MAVGETIGETGLDQSIDASDRETVYLDALAASLSDPARLAVLQRAELLEPEAIAAFDRLARLATTLLGTPVALVTMVEADRQVFLGRAGLSEPLQAERAIPLPYSLCQHVVAARSPLVIADTRAYPLVADNLAVVELGVAAYAGIPVFAPTGEALGAFCALDAQPRVWSAAEIDVLTDLAALAATEVEKRLAVVAHRRAEEDRQTLIDALAHDLKNPLAVLSLQAQLLRRQLNRHGVPDLQSLLNRADGFIRLAARMTALVDELADHARLATDAALELARTPTDLVALIRSGVEDARQVSAEHAIVFAADVDDLVGDWDAPRLRRVIDNLLNNAVKYSPEDGTVRVTVGHIDGAAVLSVDDAGIGIPADDLPHIFDLRRRGGNVVDIAGSGIGLSGVKRIVEEHGGTITVASIEGHGTTVTVHLPLHSPSDEPASTNLERVREETARD